MFRNLLGVALSALLVAACATSGDLYADADLDNDGRIDRNEFYAGAGDWGVFGDWDTDADGYLSDPEFRFGMNEIGVDYGDGFDTWDRDDDGLLTDDELYEGTFNDLDADDDGFLDRTEFEYGVRVPLP